MCRTGSSMANDKPTTDAISYMSWLQCTPSHSASASLQHGSWSTTKTCVEELGWAETTLVPSGEETREAGRTVEITRLATD